MDDDSTFVQLGEPLSPLLLEIWRKMQANKKRAA
jgi:hypothetical protein